MGKFSWEIKDHPSNSSLTERLGITPEKRKFLTKLVESLMEEHNDISLILKVVTDECDTVEEVIYATYMVSYNIAEREIMQDGSSLPKGAGMVEVRNGKLRIKGVNKRELKNVLRKLRDSIEEALESEIEDDNDLGGDEGDDDPVDHVNKLIRDSWKINGKPGESKPGDNKNEEED